MDIYNENFSSIDENGVKKDCKLADFIKGKTVLYFYPKDNTSGCTAEACDFRDNFNRIAKLATIVGISPDSIESHSNFREKHGLNFILISDPLHKLAQHFGVWKEKSMYGRKYMGIERSTFILDENGNIINEWRKVKVKGHVDEVLSKL
ncbi:MAG: peroxiredoxin [Alphaproteobacteria bacterium]|nr:peroxiredoxin [Alphaproteobacteria bacterium]